MSSERLEVGDYFEFEEIGNYYGGLCIKHSDNGYYWGIENYNGTDFKEIPKSLYDELVKFKEMDEVAE